MKSTEKDKPNKENDRTIIDLTTIKPKGLGQRHVQTLLLFLAMAISSGIRIILTVSIVDMTKNSTISPYQQFDWDELTRGLIFGCNYWGVFLSTLIAGIVIQRFGAKTPLFLSIFGMSLLAILTPIIASMGWIWMCVRQIVEGFFGGFVIVALNYLFGRWIHPIERTLLVGLVVTGDIFGKIILLLFTGLIIASPLGWPGSFYIPGIFGIMWCIAWWIYGSNSPLKNSRITNDERAFLQTIPGMTMEKQMTPWRSIITSRPVWTLIICQCCLNWSMVFLMVATPTYLSCILRFHLKSSAILTAVGFVTTLFFAILVATTSSWLIKNDYTSVGTSRKIFNTIGMWIPAFIFFVLGTIKLHSTMALILLIMAFGCNGSVISGAVLNHLDLSPNFSGTLSSLITCFGALSSIASPVFYGYVVTDVSDSNLWTNLFLTASAAYFIGNLVFIIFGHFSVQHWNETDKKSDKL